MFFFSSRFGLQKENEKGTRFIKIGRDFLSFFILGFFFQFIFIFKTKGEKTMYRIKEESSGKKTVEEIREGSIVRRAEAVSYTHLTLPTT